MHSPAALPLAYPALTEDGNRVGAAKDGEQRRQLLAVCMQTVPDRTQLDMLVQRRTPPNGYPPSTSATLASISTVADSWSYTSIQHTTIPYSVGTR
jgi:hypothetical protein